MHVNAVFTEVVLRMLVDLALEVQPHHAGLVPVCFTFVVM